MDASALHQIPIAKIATMEQTHLASLVYGTEATKWNTQLN
jgi:hypothetical protein